MTELPLLLVWKKEVGGKEGQRRTGIQNIAHLSQKLYP
jgi:hypothetical protein